MRRYVVKIIHAWMHFDGGDINYPGETSILDTFTDVHNAIAAADQAKADGKEAVVIDQEHAGGPRRIYTP